MPRPWNARWVFLSGLAVVVGGLVALSIYVWAWPHSADSATLTQAEQAVLTAALSKAVTDPPLGSPLCDSAAEIVRRKPDAQYRPPKRFSKGPFDTALSVARELVAPSTGGNLSVSADCEASLHAAIFAAEQG